MSAEGGSYGAGPSSDAPPALDADDADTLRAIRSLTELLSAAEAGGLVLQVQLQAAADELVRTASARNRSAVRLACQAWLELVLTTSHASRAAGGGHDEDTLRSELPVARWRSERYLRFAAESTAHTARLGAPFLGSVLRDGGTCDCVLTHGSFTAVTALLLLAARKAHFTLLVAEGSPDGEGHRTAAALGRAGVPVRMIEPCAVAHCMGRVQLVLCGAHAVTQEGGVVGDVGTHTMAIVARAHKRPFYVTAQHHLFCRTHELHAETASELGLPSLPGDVSAFQQQARPRRDATPAHLITLLFTDLGLLTPSAISDELLERELWSCAAGAPPRPWSSPRRGAANPTRDVGEKFTLS